MPKMKKKRRVLRLVWTIALTAILLAGMYILLIMVMPMDKETADETASVVPRNIDIFSDLSQRSDFFGRPILLLNQDLEVGFRYQSGSVAKTERGGVVTLLYQGVDGGSLTLSTVVPADDLSILRTGGYQLIADKDAYLAGTRATLLQAGQKYRLYAVSDYCLYVLESAGVTPEAFQRAAQAMQLY